MADPDLAVPVAETARSRPSLVWLMPVIAIVVAAGAVWKNYNDKGPVIAVAFPSASGITAESTELRYKDLKVGVVEDVTFSADLSSVEAHIRLDKKIAEYVDADAAFWLVEPQVSARGISGLGTVLSGVYIQGNWDSEIGAAQEHFVALAAPPLSTTGEEGTRIVLRTRAGGQLAAGAPVLFSGIEVGRIGEPVLSESGSIVTMEAFIEAPHDRRLSTNSRFWNASGLSVNVGTSGLSVNVSSLAALIEGGVNFGTPVTGGSPVEDGQVFEVFPTEAVARLDAFEGTTGREFPVSVLLESNVSGLAIGSLVKFQGIKVGEVEDITGVIPDGGDGQTVMLRVDLSLVPDRLGLPAAETPDALRAALASRVEAGLRVRLASEGLLGQTTVLEIANLPEAVFAAMTDDSNGNPRIPTAPKAVGGESSGVDGLVNRLSNLPIEELMTAATDTLSGVSRLLTNDETQKIPGNANALLSDVRTLFTGGEVTRILQNAELTTEEVRNLIGRVGNSEGLASVLRALETTEQIAGNVAAVSERLPAMADSVSQITTKVAELPIDQLVTQVGDAIARLTTVLADEAVTQIAPTAVAAVEDLRALIGSAEVRGMLQNAELTTADIRALVGRLEDSQGLASLLRALETTERIANNVADVSDRLPTMADSVNQITAKVADLPLQPLVEDAGAAIARLNTVLADEALTRIAPSAAAAVEDLRTLIGSAELRRLLQNAELTSADVRSLISRIETSEGVASLLKALETSEQIAGNVASVSERLPAMADSVSQITTNIAALPLEPLVTDAGTAIARINTVLADEALAQIAPTAAAAVEDLRTLIGSPEIRGMLQNAELTAADVRTLVARIETSEGLASLLRAMESTDEITTNLAAVSERLPAMADSVSAITADIAALPLEPLVANAGAAIARLNGILADDALGQIAPAAAATLSDVSAMVEELRAAGLVAQLNGIMGDAENLVANLGTTSASLPDLMAEVRTIVTDAQTVVAQIREVPLAGLGDSLERLTVRAEALLAAPGMDQIPASVQGTLVEVQGLLTELREGGAVASLNQTLRSAETTLTSVETAVSAVPDLVRRLNGVADGLSSVAQGYTPQSRFHDELRGAIRDISAAADSFRSLARTIERNPSSLITGR